MVNSHSIQPSVCPVCFPRSSGRLDRSAPGKVVSVVSECPDAARLVGKAKADGQRIQVTFREVDPHCRRRFGYLCGQLNHSLQPCPTCQYGNLPPTRRAAMAIVGPPRRLATGLLRRSGAGRFRTHPGLGLQWRSSSRTSWRQRARRIRRQGQVRGSLARSGAERWDVGVPRVSGLPYAEDGSGTAARS
jgi:hypothetical protein